MISLTLRVLLSLSLTVSGSKSSFKCVSKSLIASGLPGCSPDNPFIIAPAA